MKDYRPEKLPIFRPLVHAATANYAHFSQVSQHAKRRFGRHLNDAPTAAEYTQHAQWILSRLRTKPEALTLLKQETQTLRPTEGAC